jgi:hypothetical protein
LINRADTLIKVGTASLFLLLAGFAFSSSFSGKIEDSFKIVRAETNIAAQTAQKTGVTKAVAVLHPTEGNKVHGLVTFTKEGGNTGSTSTSGVIVAQRMALLPEDISIHQECLTARRLMQSATRETSAISTPISLAMPTLSSQIPS